MLFGYIMHLEVVMQGKIRLGFTAFGVLSHQALPFISPSGSCSREVLQVGQVPILKHIALKSTTT